MVLTGEMEAGARTTEALLGTIAFNLDRDNRNGAPTSGCTRRGCAIRKMSGGSSRDDGRHLTNTHLGWRDEHLSKAGNIETFMPVSNIL
jgi:hypothetical protein